MTDSTTPAVDLAALGITAQDWQKMPEAGRKALTAMLAAKTAAEAQVQAAKRTAPERQTSIKLSDKGYFVITGLADSPVVTLSPKGLSKLLTEDVQKLLNDANTKHSEAQQGKLNAYRSSDTYKAASKARKDAAKAAKATSTETAKAA